MLNSEEKKWAIEAIQEFFYRDRGEDLGLIGAENFLQFINESLAPLIYNRAIRDVKQSILQQVETIEEAVDVLQKPIQSAR